MNEIVNLKKEIDTRVMFKKDAVDIVNGLLAKFRICEAELKTDWLADASYSDMMCARLREARAQGKIDARAYNALARAYSGGRFTKPLEQLTNGELCVCSGIGKKTIDQFRTVFPNPELKGGE